MNKLIEDYEMDINPPEEFLQKHGNKYSIHELTEFKFWIQSMLNKRFTDCAVQAVDKFLQKKNNDLLKYWTEID